MYPKTVQLEDNKLKDLLTKKGALIEQGRGKSTQIELLEKEMEETDIKVQEEEKKVNIDDLLEEEKEQTKIVDECIEKMKLIKQKIYDRMIAEVPKELHEKYDKIKNKKEELETERNKLALKAQKYNDKIIPLAREQMKQHLKDQYDDYDTLYLENGEIYATIFNHLIDWKNNFKKK
jgi:phenylalanyl-tRNA synthetase alpha subunit